MSLISDYLNSSNHTFLFLLRRCIFAGHARFTNWKSTVRVIVEDFQTCPGWFTRRRFTRRVFVSFIQFAFRHGGRNNCRLHCRWPRLDRLRRECSQSFLRFLSRFAAVARTFPRSRGRLPRCSPRCCRGRCCRCSAGCGWDPDLLARRVDGRTRNLVDVYGVSLSSRTLRRCVYWENSLPS